MALLHELFLPGMSYTKKKTNKTKPEVKNMCNKHKSVVPDFSFLCTAFQKCFTAWRPEAKPRAVFCDQGVVTTFVFHIRKVMPFASFGPALC